MDTNAKSSDADGERTSAKGVKGDDARSRGEEDSDCGEDSESGSTDSGSDASSSGEEEDATTENGKGKKVKGRVEHADLAGAMNSKFDQERAEAKKRKKKKKKRRDRDKEKEKRKDEKTLPAPLPQPGHEEQQPVASGSGSGSSSTPAPAPASSPPKVAPVHLPLPKPTPTGPRAERSVPTEPRAERTIPIPTEPRAERRNDTGSGSEYASGYAPYGFPPYPPLPATPLDPASTQTSPQKPPKALRPAPDADVLLTTASLTHHFKAKDNIFMRGTGRGDASVREGWVGLSASPEKDKSKEHKTGVDGATAKTFDVEGSAPPHPHPAPSSSTSSPTAPSSPLKPIISLSVPLPIPTPVPSSSTSAQAPAQRVLTNKSVPKPMSKYAVKKPPARPMGTSTGVGSKSKEKRSVMSCTPRDRLGGNVGAKMGPRANESSKATDTVGFVKDKGGGGSGDSPAASPTKKKLNDPKSPSKSPATKILTTDKNPGTGTGGTAATSTKKKNETSKPPSKQSTKSSPAASTPTKVAAAATAVEDDRACLSSAMRRDAGKAVDVDEPKTSPAKHALSSSSQVAGAAVKMRKDEKEDDESSKTHVAPGDTEVVDGATAVEDDQTRLKDSMRKDEKEGSAESSTTLSSSSSPGPPAPPREEEAPVPIPKPPITSLVAYTSSEGEDDAPVVVSPGKGKKKARKVVVSESEPEDGDGDGGAGSLFSGSGKDTGTGTGTGTDADAEGESEGADGDEVVEVDRDGVPVPSSAPAKTGTEKKKRRMIFDGVHVPLLSAQKKAAYVVHPEIRALASTIEREHERELVNLKKVNEEDCAGEGRRTRAWRENPSRGVGVGGKGKEGWIMGDGTGEGRERMLRYEEYVGSGDRDVGRLWVGAASRLRWGGAEGGGGERGRHSGFDESESGDDGEYTPKVKKGKGKGGKMRTYVSAGRSIVARRSTSVTRGREGSTASASTSSRSVSVSVAGRAGEKRKRAHEDDEEYVVRKSSLGREVKRRRRLGEGDDGDDDGEWGSAKKGRKRRIVEDEEEDGELEGEYDEVEDRVVVFPSSSSRVYSRRKGNDREKSYLERILAGAGIKSASVSDSVGRDVDLEWVVHVRRSVFDVDSNRVDREGKVYAGGEGDVVFWRGVERVGGNVKESVDVPKHTDSAGVGEKRKRGRSKRSVAAEEDEGEVQIVDDFEVDSERPKKRGRPKKSSLSAQGMAEENNAVQSDVERPKKKLTAMLPPPVPVTPKTKPATSAAAAAFTTPKRDFDSLFTPPASPMQNSPGQAQPFQFSPPMSAKALGKQRAMSLAASMEVEPAVTLSEKALGKRRALPFHDEQHEEDEVSDVEQQQHEEDEETGQQQRQGFTPEEVAVLANALRISREHYVSQGRGHELEEMFWDDDVIGAGAGPSNGGGTVDPRVLGSSGGDVQEEDSQDVEVEEVQVQQQLAVEGGEDVDKDADEGGRGKRVKRKTFKVAGDEDVDVVLADTGKRRSGRPKKKVEFVDLVGSGEDGEEVFEVAPVVEEEEQDLQPDVEIGEDGVELHYASRDPPILFNTFPASYWEVTNEEDVEWWCHQCRRRTPHLHMDCSTCAKSYCNRCLRLRYPDRVKFDSTAKDWSCPRCEGYCNCTQCCKPGTYISSRKSTASSASRRVMKPRAGPKSKVAPRARTSQGQGQGQGQGQKRKKTTTKRRLFTPPPPEYFESEEWKNASIPWHTIYDLQGKKMGVVLAPVGNEMPGPGAELKKPGVVKLRVDEGYRPSLEMAEYYERIGRKRESEREGEGGEEEDSEEGREKKRKTRRMFVGKPLPHWEKLPGVKIRDVSPDPVGGYVGREEEAGWVRRRRRKEVKEKEAKERRRLQEEEEMMVVDGDAGGGGFVDIEDGAGDEGAAGGGAEEAGSSYVQDLTPTRPSTPTAGSGAQTASGSFNTQLTLTPFNRSNGLSDRELLQRIPSFDVGANAFRSPRRSQDVMMGDEPMPLLMGNAHAHVAIAGMGVGDPEPFREPNFLPNFLPGAIRAEEEEREMGAVEGSMGGGGENS